MKIIISITIILIFSQILALHTKSNKGKTFLTNNKQILNNNLKNKNNIDSNKNKDNYYNNGNCFALVNDWFYDLYGIDNVDGT
jgi:hypothetical protein